LLIFGYGYVGRAMCAIFRRDFRYVVDPRHGEEGLTRWYDENGSDGGSESGPLAIMHSFEPSCVPPPRAIIVCVGTPMACDPGGMPMPDASAGSRTGIPADLSAVESVCDLIEQAYKDVLVILKSTIPPDWLKAWGCQPHRNRWVYCPEFLRAAHWEQDALKPPMLVLGGEYDACCDARTLFDQSLMEKTPVFHLSMVQASVVKYMINTFLAMKVVFMHEWAAVLGALGEGVDAGAWGEVVAAFHADPRTGGSHGDVWVDGIPGFGGACLPKDISAANAFIKALGVTAELLSAVERINWCWRS
jgi:UDP-glucose 6-dehydrogenase